MASSDSQSQALRVKPPPARSVVTGLVTGFVFGLLLEKCKVYLPHVIFSQMVFTHFVMLKIFLSAMTVGMAVILALETFGIRQRPPPLKSSLAFGWFNGYDGNVIGGCILGAGMSITGACPGQVFAQLGAGVPSAPFVFAGAVCAAVTFPYITFALGRYSRGGRFHFVQPGARVDDLLGVSYAKVFVGFAAAMAMLILAVDTAFPWRTEVAPYVVRTDNAGNTVWTDTVWSPVMSGVGIGLLQLFAIVIGGSPLGQSSCYVTAAGLCMNAVDSKAAERAPYFFRHFEPWHWWQLAVAVANVAGAYFSIWLSGAQLSAFALHACPSALRGFVGGFVMLFGARLGDGCPSGHGLSGTARLNFAGFVTVAAMFAGGITTAVAMRAAGMGL